MPMFRPHALAAVALLALAACGQQQPAPIQPEPVYDKYGNASAICVPSNPQDRIPGAAYRPGLPVCETACPEGSRPAAAGTANQDLVCVPIRRGGEGNGGGQRTPNDPAGLPGAGG